MFLLVEPCEKEKAFPSGSPFEAGEGLAMWMCVSTDRGFKTSKARLQLGTSPLPKRVGAFGGDHKRSESSTRTAILTFLESYAAFSGVSHVFLASKNESHASGTQAKPK